MSSRNAGTLAAAFSTKVLRLDATRDRVEKCYQSGALRIGDVEAMYAGLFLQAMVTYESTMEAFVLGLMVKPGGIVSSNTKVRSRVRVRSYSHALAVAAGPGRKYPQWIGRKDLEDAAELLLLGGAPFLNAAPPVDWTYVEKCRHIRNAIAHPSKHSVAQFERHVVQSTPLPWRERQVAGFLRGSASAGQTRWETYVAGLRQFVANLVA